MKKHTILGFIAGLAVASDLVVSLPDTVINNSVAAISSEPKAWSKTQPYPVHDVYYPGSEAL